MVMGPTLRLSPEMRWWNAGNVCLFPLVSSLVRVQLLGAVMCSIGPSVVLLAPWPSLARLILTGLFAVRFTLALCLAE